MGCCSSCTLPSLTPFSPFRQIPLTHSYETKASNSVRFSSQAAKHALMLDTLTGSFPPQCKCFDKVYSLLPLLFFPVLSPNPPPLSYVNNALFSYSSCPSALTPSRRRHRGNARKIKLTLHQCSGSHFHLSIPRSQRWCYLRKSYLTWPTPERKTRALFYFTSYISNHSLVTTSCQRLCTV